MTVRSLRSRGLSGWRGEGRGCWERPRPAGGSCEADSEARTLAAAAAAVPGGTKRWSRPGSPEAVSTGIQENSWIIFLLIMATIFWIYRLIKVFCNILSYWEIRQFYIKALKIRMDELCNFTWQEVQDRLISLQREQQMCIHKKELTELDIYHRILRFKNYMVAMVNKSLLPVHLQLPLLGDIVFLTQGLQVHFRAHLSGRPGSLFTNKWNLHPQLSRVILLMGVANLLLCPLHTWLWQLHGGDPREPGSLVRAPLVPLRPPVPAATSTSSTTSCTDGWARVQATSKYMNSFTSPADDRCWQERGLLLGARSFIPDEHMVWCPEQLLQCVLAHIHYMPDHWRGYANKGETRDEVAQLFQYKAVFILEELLSPIVTPFVLIFLLRNKSLDIIDFFRNFTVEVWTSEGQTEASIYQQAENGKTELSLMHFTIKNPRWQPPQESSVFISHLKEKVQQDAQAGPSTQLLLSEAPLCTSLLSNESGSGVSSDHHQHHHYSA
ncbi:hypothetical protein CRUP_006506 [Coryphaenoides rupestris]|nr:hypothetical protein CRUP_006506 [Coryphaenoides rupestris]